MAGEQGTLDSTLGGNYINKASNYGPAFFKVAELILSIVCMALFDDPANNSRFRIFVGTRTIALAYVTFGSFIIIAAAYLLGKIFRDTFPWRVTALLNLVGAILFTACAVTILKDWSDTKERNYWPPNTTRMDLVCATGAISIIGAVVFVIDLMFVFRLGARGELQ
ncbi:hypothetical protein PVAND_011533 [Polypedilum vanderplanki]|uniref:DUF7775 domain-containing protein n=1 Tax=Polypedilum vanderplanki TaxID=319348 RepID=A0A9J6CIW6_POLVA|nr:hypothetical protein PVAND_011533 [Polypedilum vanderplanki]